MRSHFHSYNCPVAKSYSLRSFFVFILLAVLLPSGGNVQAAQNSSALNAQDGEVTAYDLILAMNTLRVSYGNRALVEDPIIDAVAQSTAEIMAANEMSWHIGDVSGRLASAGYGGGAKIWATENFAYGDHTIDEVMLAWSDESHMIPAVNPAYCNVGAGVAKAPNGMTYYVLQAAYVAGKSCGEYSSPGGGNSNPGGNGEGNLGISQIIVPVKIATPDPDGKVFHVVEAGQSFWSIAIAYKITIKDLEIWNNLSRENGLRVGQRLFIPNSNTKGYATPTPVGMVILSTPDVDGKIIHTVEAYQTLSTIAKAYGVSVERILNLNSIQENWPLQIGQKLLIDPGHVTPSPTPRPLTPLEKLTPESDGKYYHIVQSGETLSWIASLYEVNMFDLMRWNGLNESSILVPDQKLLLQVTPPAVATSTPPPSVQSIQSTRMPTPTLTVTPSPTLSAVTPAFEAVNAQPGGNTSPVWLISLGLAVVGLGLVAFSLFKKRDR